jgi:hypothetical protein
MYVATRSSPKISNAARTGRLAGLCAAVAAMLKIIDLGCRASWHRVVAERVEAR